MEFDELIEKRRSERFFDGTKKVSVEDLKKMVEAAIQAPSWKNAQTARYYCIYSDDKISEVREALPEFNKKNTDGAVLVISTFIKNRSGFTREGVAENEVGNGWGFYDLGLHNENFILKAKDLGIDTLITGIRDAEKIRTILDIPEDQIIVSVIAVGYGTKEMKKPKRKLAEDILRLY